MPFSELSFIFVFLPIFLVIYRICGERPRRLELFLGGLLFYFIGILMQPAASAAAAVSFPSVLLFTWIVSIILPDPEKTGRKAVLAFAVAVLVCVLAAFKYLFPPVPPGMSFYIFTAIAYLADISRGEVRSESLTDFGSYFAFFPKLLSGPVTRRKEMGVLGKEDGSPTGNLAEGIRLFITGLAEKVLLADTLGRLWGSISAAGFDSISTPLAWLGAAAFSMQLYHDFQSYSVMACGIGTMLGTPLPRNFDYPYLSRSISEFWRRWHITLGLWFRDYVYIPLGGSRNGGAKTVRNLFIVWLLTGMWHGATVNFLLWGMMMFLLAASEKFLTGGFLSRHAFISRVYVLTLVPVSWMLFAHTDLGDLVMYLGRMFSFSGGIVNAGRFIESYAVSLAAGAVFCTPLPGKLFAGIREGYFGTLIYMAMLAGSVYMIWKSGGVPFLYFSF